MAFFSETELKQISEGEKTDLCDIMNAYGSDKGNGHHNYTKLYSRMFESIRDKPLNILEIGIGTINPNLVSSMCGIPNYKPGASHRGWRDYFRNSMIYGCDIDKNIIDFGTEPRIKGFYIDQRDKHNILDTFFFGELKDVKFDIIVDDGLHNFNVNFSIMCILMNKLNENGIYIIEDICDFNNKEVPFKYPYQYICLPNPRNNADNNLFIAKKT